MDEKFFFDAMTAVGLEVIVVDENTPLGQQPKPVKVTIEGELSDVYSWSRRLRRKAEFDGAEVSGIVSHHEETSKAEFTIYSRAVND